MGVSGKVGLREPRTVERRQSSPLGGAGRKRACVCDISILNNGVECQWTQVVAWAACPISVCDFDAKILESCFVESEGGLEPVDHRGE